MIILIEGLIGIAIFALITITLLLRNPLDSIGDYPPAIQERCIELGLIDKRERRFSRSERIRKAAAMIVLAFVMALVVKYVNGAQTFWQGFTDTYLIWLIIDWYDALIQDCVWFCHSKKVRIPGTEEMKEYQDYLFHIKQSCIGMILGIPVALLVGLFTAII